MCIGRQGKQSGQVRQGKLHELGKPGGQGLWRNWQQRRRGDKLAFDTQQQLLVGGLRQTRQLWLDLLLHSMTSGGRHTQASWSGPCVTLALRLHWLVYS